MKIRVNETFSHESGCYTQGSEADVTEALGREVVTAGLAVEIPLKAAPKPKAVKSGANG